MFLRRSTNHVNIPVVLHANHCVPTYLVLVFSHAFESVKLRKVFRADELLDQPVRIPGMEN